MGQKSQHQIIMLKEGEAEDEARCEKCHGSARQLQASNPWTAFSRTCSQGIHTYITYFLSGTPTGFI